MAGQSIADYQRTLEQTTRANTELRRQVRDLDARTRAAEQKARQGLSLGAAFWPLLLGVFAGAALVYLLVCRNA